jgi:predicted metal-dependent hydrolase
VSRILRVGLPHSATPDQIKDSVQAWLMRHAKTHFTERLDHFAPQLQVRWHSLRLSNASTRWGSAKSDGSIRLNWRLIHFSPAVVDYVVAHELSHLREMNHSPRFWDTVRTVVPDYAQLRGQLKDDAVPRW